MGFKTRDKTEMAIATLVLFVWIVGFELTTLGGSPTWPTRLLVLASAFTIFGDNVMKAREFLGGDSNGS